MEYELIDFSWSLPYCFNEESFPSFVADHSHIDVIAPTDQPQESQFDADGIPMGQSMDDIRCREKIIDDFFRSWVESHPEKCVYNENLQENILVRVISIIEAKQHAAKRYQSTLAVLKLDEVLRCSRKAGEMPTKVGNANQASFERMLILSHEMDEIGTVKLTVGVRRSNKDKVQYGISALQSGQELIDPEKNSVRGRKKKASHRK